MQQDLGQDRKIATLISGGLDSATLIAWASSQGYDQLALFVNYFALK